MMDYKQGVICNTNMIKCDQENLRYLKRCVMTSVHYIHRIQCAKAQDLILRIHIAS